MNAIAEESITRDLQDEDVEAAIQDDESTTALSRPSTQDLPPLGEYSLVGGHRRRSHISNVPGPLLGWQQPDCVGPVEEEREAAIVEERTLLEDNSLIRPKHPPRRDSQASKTSKSGSFIPGFLRPQRSKASLVDEESGPPFATLEPSETTALLSSSSSSSEETSENIDQKWEEAILSGDIQTTWQREAKTLASYSGPLILTFILQNSLTLTSIFTVGHIGKIELGAVSLGGMTANITGYAVYHGLATSLDTLCAQAYGSGKKKLVGLNLQRMVFFLWTITIPIAVLWFFGTEILMLIVPEKEIAVLAGRYLKVLILGAPGYACFEASKRYVQAQGRFEATLYVLLVAAPANVLMHWLFVWVRYTPSVIFGSTYTNIVFSQHFGWGFIGCPIAVVITETSMPLLLLVYVRSTSALECWPGFSRAAFRNWGPMVRLALPGLVMVMAEFLAFEILTLAAANFSATHLAANTVLQSLSVFTYQLPFPLSIAGSTRVANLIGAGLDDAAKCTARVMLIIGIVIGIFNMVMLSVFRGWIPTLFTREPDVIALAATVLPVNAAFQLFDSLAAQCNGILRGLGKQDVGGICSLVAFYVVSVSLRSTGTFWKRKEDLAADTMLVARAPDILWYWIWFTLGAVRFMGRTCDWSVHSSYCRRHFHLQNELEESK